MREIIFYETDFGKKPVDEFLGSLEPAPRAKVVRTLELLRTQPIVPSKFWKKLPHFRRPLVLSEFDSHYGTTAATGALGWLSPLPFFAVTGGCHKFYSCRRRR